LANEDEVVVDAPASYEGVLDRADEVVEPWSKAQRQGFGEDLGHQVDQAYGPVIQDFTKFSFL
jgi:16S rRNA C967 or C1407 C5-methylase (RsmB/RsmF family)